MNDAAETAAARLWRDRAQIREHERDEARAQARIAAEKVAILSAENDRLSTENARLRAQIDPDAHRTRTETEMQMEALRGALTSLLLPLSEQSSLPGLKRSSQQLDGGRLRWRVGGFRIGRGGVS